MKTRIWLEFLIAVALAGFVFTLGCASNSEQARAAETTPNLGTTNGIAAVVPASTDSEPVNKIDAAPPVTSPGLDEIIKLAQSHVDESVMLAFIENSPVAYDPSVEEILYLNDIGISPKIISALVSHGRTLRAKQAATNPPVTVVNTPPPLPSAPTPGEEPPAPTGAPANQPLAPAPESLSQYAAYSPMVYPAQNPGVQVEYAQAQPPPAVTYFQEPLSPYGSWMQIPDYGWCWQPMVTSINPAWNPYCDGGRWLYTDCGWYWQSDYSWGWAPFHYGRWFRHGNYGWMWAPDTVWGPSWVCWRRTPLYCGWAPLPPGAGFDPAYGFSYYGVGVADDFGFGLSASFYTFIPLSRFCDRYPWHYYVHGERGKGLYNQSTVAHRYFKGPNNTIVNEGIDRDTIAHFTRTEVRKVAIRDLPPASGKFVKPDRVEKDGSSLVIYRPQIQRAPANRPAVALSQGRPELGNNSAASIAGQRSLSPGPANSTPRGITLNERTSPGNQAVVNRSEHGAANLVMRPSETAARTVNGGVPVTTATPPAYQKRVEDRRSIVSPMVTSAAPTPINNTYGSPGNRPVARSEVSKNTGAPVSASSYSPTIPAQSRVAQPAWPANSASSSLPWQSGTISPPPRAMPSITPAPDNNSFRAPSQYTRGEVNKPAPAYSPNQPAAWSTRPAPAYSQPQVRPNFNVPAAPSNPSYSIPVNRAPAYSPPPAATVYQPRIQSSPAPSYSPPAPAVRSAPPPTISVQPSAVSRSSAPAPAPVSSSSRSSSGTGRERN